MKTTHQLAKELLAGPDMPVVVPSREDGFYDEPRPERKRLLKKYGTEMVHDYSTIPSEPIDVIVL